MAGRDRVRLSDQLMTSCQVSKTAGSGLTGVIHFTCDLRFIEIRQISLEHVLNGVQDWLSVCDGDVLDQLGHRL